MTGEQYDVFVSYAPQDGEVVRGYLLAALEASGVRWCSTDTFPLGLPRVEAMSRGVEASRRVVLVLSPAYLSDHEQAIAGLLAQHYGAERATWPVVPLVIAPVAQLPLRLRLLGPVDATTRATRAEAMARLCDELGRPLETARALPPCPYPGMRPFDTADADEFHGRENEIREALARLRLNRWLVVIGASGCGKSSLVRAGIVPRLLARGVDVVRWRPGRDPLLSLAAVLPSEVDPDADPDDAEPERLLVADQLEELFLAAATRPEVVQQVWDVLSRAVESGRLRCVMTVRADFYPQLMGSPLWAVVVRHRLEIVPLDAGQLREAIVGPAENVGVYVEAALVERLVDDAAGEPGVLPFVQETLVLLWEQIEYRYLPVSAYDALVLARARYGASPVTGLQVAMAARADALMATLASPAEQRIARRILLRLVQFVDGRADVRQQQRVDDLRSEDDDPPVFRRVLDTLVGGHLLTASARADGAVTLIDLSHEALILGWPLLRELAAERRAAEHVRRRLEAAAEGWAERGRGDVALLDAVEVREAEQWLTGVEAADVGVGGDVADYVRASRAEVDAAAARRRRVSRTLRALSATLAVLLVLALAATVVAVGQRNGARIAEQTAQAGELGLLASLAPPQDLDRALLLGVEATRLRTTTRSRAGLLAAVRSNPRVERVQTFAGPLIALAVSPARDRVAVADRLTGTVTVLDAAAGRQVGPARVVPTEVRALAFGPDGVHLAATGKDGRTYEWVTTGDVPGGVDGSDGTGQVGPRTDHAGSARAVAYSPDGRWRATGGSDGQVVVVARDTGQARRFPGHRDWVNALAFTPDSRLLLSAGGATEHRSQDGRILVRDVVTGRLVRQLPDPGDAVRALAVAPREPVVAAAGADGVVRLWNHTTGAEVRTLSGHHDRVFDVAYSPDGSLLASAGRDGEVRVWDPATGSAVTAPLRGHGTAVRGIDFLGDRTLVGIGDDGRALVWSLLQPTPARLATALPSAGRPGRPVHAVAADPLRGLAATGDDDGLVTIRRLADGHVLRSFSTVHRSGPQPVWGLAFTPDGRLVTATSLGDLQVWDPATGTSVAGPVSTGERALHLATSPDGRYVAGGGESRRVLVWDRNLQLVQAPARGHTSSVMALAFRSSDGTLFTAGYDGALWAWRVGSPSGPSTSSAGRRVGQVTGGLWSLALTPDGRTLATGDNDGRIIFWDPNGQDVSAVGRPFLQEHTSTVTGLGFTPDGAHLVSADAEGAVRLSDREGGRTRDAGELGRRDATHALAVGGATVLVGSDSGVARWTLDPGQWQQVACRVAGRNLRAAELQEYTGETRYRATCPGLPEPPPAPQLPPVDDE